ncbi:hypothetical protein [Vibrio sp. CyArs1]|uniref:hypothetical protein n=1 Tax=Vibrio sp. CyArs1 TaxID=2682577 RepID=UPI001F06E23F|nr:hypothetical protein [Vibrio sp. CyArs1]
MRYYNKKSNVLGLIFLISSSLHGATLQGVVNNGTVNWSSLQKLEDEIYTTSFWDLPDKSIPTMKWVPGAISLSQPHVTLSNGSESVQLPISAVGVEYETSNIAAIELEGGGPICDTNVILGTRVKLIGPHGCSSNSSVNYNFSTKPFTHNRIIYSIDNESIVNNFSGKSAGIYRGTLTSTLFYDFYTVQGVKSRQHITRNVSVELELEDYYISSVDVQGESRFENIIHNGKIFGETTHNVTVHGELANGIDLSFSSGKQYSLRSPSGSEIPYSIECDKCSARKIVEEGSIVSSSTTVEAEPSDSSNIDFNLRVFFKDLETTGLDNGIYSDTVYIMVQPRM